MDVLVKAFVEKQRDLIELEYQEQLACQAEYLTKLSKQQLQRKGVALLNLRESNRATGLAGKLYVITLFCHLTNTPFIGSLSMSEVTKMPCHRIKSK